MISFGILGGGRIARSMEGRSHGPAGQSRLCRRCRRKGRRQSGEAVAPRSPRSRRIIKAKDTGCHTHRDTHRHPCRFDRAAAKAGKMILCEKPVSLSVSGSRNAFGRREGKSAADDRLPPRYDPISSVLERRLRKGEAGAVEIVTITCRDPARRPSPISSASGGLYRAYEIHAFRYVALPARGEEIDIVHALGAIWSIRRSESWRYRIQPPSTCRRSAAPWWSSPIRRRATYGHDRVSKCMAGKRCFGRQYPSERQSNAPMARAYRGPHPFSSSNAMPRPTARSLGLLDALEKGCARRRPVMTGDAQKLAEAATESWTTGKPVKGEVGQLSPSFPFSRLREKVAARPLRCILV